MIFPTACYRISYSCFPFSSSPPLGCISVHLFSHSPIFPSKKKKKSFRNTTRFGYWFIISKLFVCGIGHVKELVQHAAVSIGGRGSQCQTMSPIQKNRLCHGYLGKGRRAERKEILIGNWDIAVSSEPLGKGNVSTGVVPVSSTAGGTTLVRELRIWMGYLRAVGPRFP